MQILSTIFLALSCVIVNTWAQAYPTKYDNINLDNILSNNRLLRGYVNCLLGKQKCTKEGEVLKEILPDALQTQCSKCNPTQAAGAKRVIRHLIRHNRNWWNEIEAMYDKTGSYRKNYEAELKKQGQKL